MSVKVMGAVFDLDIAPAAKFVLLAYADHADHYGRQIYPAIGTIAKKTGYKDRQVQRITRKLEELQLLVPDHISDKIKTNQYKIPFDPNRGVIFTPVGVSSLQGGGVIQDENQGEESVKMTPEPSFNRPQNNNELNIWLKALRLALLDSSITERQHKELSQVMLIEERDSIVVLGGGTQELLGWLQEGRPNALFRKIMSGILGFPIQIRIEMEAENV